jgi:hypothetical protein
MKKLLILTALTMVVGALSGCECLDWLCRGAYTRPYQAAAPVYTAPAPYCQPCDPCGCGVPATVVPGPTG